MKSGSTEHTEHSSPTSMDKQGSVSDQTALSFLLPLFAHNKRDSSSFRSEEAAVAYAGNSVAFMFSGPF